MFALMETYEPVWRSQQDSQNVMMFGFPFDVGVEPLQVNTERMIAAYVQGVTDLREIYQSFLRPQTFDAHAACTQARGHDFRQPDALWVHTLYEFAAAWHRRKIDRDHLMQSLVPLYLGRTASFILEVQDAGAAEVEERIERLGDVFEAEKTYLLECWGSATGKEQAHAKPV
jgi:hypothetical protein